METFIFLVIAAFIGYAFFKKQKRETREQATQAKAEGFQKNKRFLPPIPRGHKILYDRVQVSGTNHRGDSVAEFILDEDQSLRLERDQGNAYDANAIKVLGVSRSGTRHIGFVPKDIAAEIAANKSMPVISPRLRYINMKHRSGKEFYLDVEFDITGPKPTK